MGSRICEGITLCTLLLFFSPAHAQNNSVWNSTGSAKNAAGSATTNTKHKLKDYKEHLEHWGMDTNYNHTFLIGGKLNSDGWSGSLYLVKRKNYRTSNFWQFSFSEIKHEKQVKEQSTASYPQFGNASPYVFGKINNLYTLQIGFGKEKLLLPAVMDGNISVSFRYSLGLSLAMLKPYYLKLLYPNANNPDTVHIEQHKYALNDTAFFLNPARIFGASTWTKGLNEITYVPGAYFEMAIAIIPGKKAFVQVVTLGVNAAYYAQSLPIMADNTAYPWEVSLFAGLAVGKRWK